MKKKNDLQNELSEAIEKNDSLSQEVKKLATSIENLKSSDETKNLANDVNKEFIVELEKQIGQLKEKNSRLLEDIEIHKKNHYDTEKSLSEKLLENSQTHAELQGKLTESEKLLQTKEDEKQKLISSSDQMRGHLLNLGSKFGIENKNEDNSNNADNSVESIIDEMSTKLSLLQLQSSNLESETEKLDSFKEKLEEKDTEKRHLQAAIEVKEIEYEKLEKTMKQLKNDLSNKESLIEQLKTSKQKSHDKFVNELKTQNQNLQSQIKEKCIQEITSLSKIEELECKNLNIETKLQQLEESRKGQLEEVRKLATSHDVIVSLRFFFTLSNDKVKKPQYEGRKYINFRRVSLPSSVWKLSKVARETILFYLLLLYSVSLLMKGEILF